jgi:hypothetical protein
MAGSAFMILHHFRAGSPVVTDTGCCLPAARPRRPRPSGPQPLIGVPSRLQRGRQPHQGRPATQQGPQQLGQSGRIDLVVLEPAEAITLQRLGCTRCGSDSSSTSQPPAGGSLERTAVPGGNPPRIGISLAGSLGRLRLLGDAGLVHRGRPGSACGGRPSRRTPSSGPPPELVDPRSLGCRAEQGTEARPT